MKEGKSFQGKVISVPDQEQRHEKLRESGGVAPLIPKFGTWLRRVVSFTPRQPYSRGKR